MHTQTHTHTHTHKHTHIHTHTRTITINNAATQIALYIHVCWIRRDRLRPFEEKVVYASTTITFTMTWFPMLNFPNLVAEEVQTTFYSYDPTSIWWLILLQRANKVDDTTIRSYMILYVSLVGKLHVFCIITINIVLDDQNTHCCAAATAYLVYLVVCVCVCMCVCVCALCSCLLNYAHMFSVPVFARIRRDNKIVITSGHTRRDTRLTLYRLALSYYRRCTNICDPSAPCIQRRMDIIFFVM